MTSALPPFWEAEGFHGRVNAWLDTEDPPYEILDTVVSWIERLIDNPYLSGGVRQVDIAPNLWWARIPGTERSGRSVYCSFWIDEEMRRVRCDQIATLSP